MPPFVILVHAIHERLNPFFDLILQHFGFGISQVENDTRGPGRIMVLDPYGRTTILEYLGKSHRVARLCIPKYQLGPVQSVVNYDFSIKRFMFFHSQSISKYSSRVSNSLKFFFLLGYVEIKYFRAISASSLFRDFKDNFRLSSRS